MDEKEVVKQVLDALLGCSTSLFQKTQSSDEELLLRLLSVPHSSSSSSSVRSRCVTATTAFALSASCCALSLPHSVSSAALQRLLKWFCSLANHIHLTRLFSSPLTDKYLSTHAYKHEISALQASVHELLVSLEQALSLWDARLAGHLSLCERACPLLLAQCERESERETLTLLSLYRAVRRWESLFLAMTERVVWLIDALGLYVVQHVQQRDDDDTHNVAHALTTRPHNAVSQRSLSEDVQFFHCFGVLCELESVVRQGSLSHTLPQSAVSHSHTHQHQPHNAFTQCGGSHSHATHMSLSLVSEESERDSLFLFSRKTFVSYLERLLTMLFKRMWSSHNAPVQSSHLHQTPQQVKYEQNKVAEDRALLHEMIAVLGAHSFLAPLLCDLDESREELEILCRSHSERQRSAKFAFSKVQFLNLIKDKANTLLDSLSQSDLALSSSHLPHTQLDSVSVLRWLKELRPLETFLRNGRLVDVLQSYYRTTQDEGSGGAAREIDSETERDRDALKTLCEELQRLVVGERRVVREKEIETHNAVWEEKESSYNTLSQSFSSSQTFSLTTLQQLLSLIQDLLCEKDTHTPHNCPSQDTHDSPHKERVSQPTPHPLPSQLIPFSLRLQVDLFLPVRDELRVVREKAMSLLHRDYALYDHVVLWKDVYLCGKLDVMFSPLRDFAMSLVYFPQSGFEESAAERDRAKHHHVAQFNSLRHAISVSVEDLIPSRGLHHHSVFLPSVQEAWHIHGSVLREREQDEALLRASGTTDGSVFPSPLKATRNTSDLQIDETLLLLLLSQMKVELHYQWPLSTLFSLSLAQRLQSIQRFLVALSCGKWLADGWWKAFVSRSGRCSSLSPREENKNTDARERERDLTRIKRLCQHVLMTYAHTTRTLHGFFLATIHTQLWEEFSLACLSRTSSVLALRDGLHVFVEKIELLIALCKDPLFVLQRRCVDALSALRAAIESEFQGNAREQDDAVWKAYRRAESQFERVLHANEEFVESVRSVNVLSNTLSSQFSVDQLHAIRELQVLL